MPGAEHACRVVAPVRCQYDVCAAELEQAFETIQQHRVDNKWKLAGVWRPLAVEDPIDIQKDDFHPAGADGAVKARSPRRYCTAGCRRCLDRAGTSERAAP